MRMGTRQAAELALLLVAVIWGSSYAVAKQALLFYPVLGFIAARFGLTCLLLAPALRGGGLAALRPGLPLGLLLLAIFLCETYGVLLTSASNAAFLISLCVLFTPIVEWALFGRRPRALLLVACALAVAGVWLLTGGAAIRFGLGDGLMLGAALLRAGFVCFTQRLTAGRDVPALALTAVQSGVVAVGCLALAFALPGGLPALPRSGAFWLAVVYLVLFATLLAFFVQNFALRASSPTRVSMLMGTEPLFGALFASLWLDEQLGAGGWAGGLLLVLASLWAVRLTAAPAEGAPSRAPLAGQPLAEP
ncbi:DMT family transporter [Stutzerimonas azotifigens]|uniref:DMT family transporter n=1 Tax=Stutzerimonas azotifigens TaxID=291995 RepID=UPI000485B864|nr:DMT family transporter [Stutzerimonas azotifigens]